MNENLLSIIQSISKEIGSDLGKKQLQKLVYILEAKGIKLGYEYSIHFYGPYSEDLNHDLLILNSEGYVDLQITESTHQIIPHGTTEAAPLNLTPEDRSLLLATIHEYREYTPSKLELLTTAHFVALYFGKTDDDILRGVKKIKGAKYTDAQIKDVVKHIRKNFNLDTQLAV